MPRSFLTILSEGAAWYARGKSAEVAEMVLRKPDRLEELVLCLFDDDPGTANRAGHAVLAAAPRLADRVTEFRHALLELVVRSPHWFVRYRVARVVSLLMARGHWPVAEIGSVFSVYERLLSDPQAAIRVEGVEGVTRCGIAAPEYLETATWLVEKALVRPTPAIASRGRKMLALLRRRQ